MTDQSNQGLGIRLFHHFARRDGVDLDLRGPDVLAGALERRARIADLFVSGECGVELETFKAAQQRERQEAKT